MKLSITNDALGDWIQAPRRAELSEAQTEERLLAEEERRLAQGAKRFNRSAWMRTWAFPIYSSMTEFV